MLMWLARFGTVAQLGSAYSMRPCEQHVSFPDQVLRPFETVTTEGNSLKNHGNRVPAAWHIDSLNCLCFR